MLSRRRHTGSGAIEYVLRARDPSGAFVRMAWRSMVLPRVGDSVMLPEVDGDWQEMTVGEVVHYPDPDLIEIWLVGADGWEAGSVARLFESRAS